MKATSEETPNPVREITKSLPTFVDLCALHEISLEELGQMAIRAGVSEDSISALLAGSPVGQAEAICVLEVFSLFVRESYTFDSCAIPVVD